MSLPFRNKGVYNHLTTLCENWNTIEDTCNGQDDPPTSENSLERQTKLLNVLDWFSKWKKRYAEAVADEQTETDRYIFLQMKRGSISDH